MKVPPLKSSINYTSKMQSPTGYNYHALKVAENICTGCTHCMQVCPTEAIRVRGKLAGINGVRCVDCGECVKACPVNAIQIEHDDFNLIYKYPNRVALVPSVFIGQFADMYSTNQIYSALYELGFTNVCEVEHSVEILNDLAIDYYKNYKGEKPLISAFCPAIVRLIQGRFPALVENIMPVRPPVELAALYYQKKLLKRGIKPEDIGLFYISPCAAKIASVKSPISEESGLFQGVINMDFLYNRVLRLLKNTSKPFELRNYTSSLTAKGVLWALTNGESDHMPGRTLAIDGIHNVIDFLELLENGEIQDVDFIEVRACDHSCAGGILSHSNRFLVVERMRKRALRNADIKQNSDIRDIDKYKDYLEENGIMGAIPQLPMQNLDEDITRAIAKLQRQRKLMCYLPGIDCAACGAPTCAAFARDVVTRKADLSECVFLQRMMEKHGKLSPEHAFRINEKIWGKNRFEKDCNRKGAENENI